MTQATKTEEPKMMILSYPTPTMLTIERESIPGRDPDDDLYFVSAHYSDGAVHCEWSGQNGYQSALYAAEDLKKQMDWESANHRSGPIIMTKTPRLEEGRGRRKGRYLGTPSQDSVRAAPRVGGWDAGLMRCGRSRARNRMGHYREIFRSNGTLVSKGKFK